MSRSVAAGICILTSLCIGARTGAQVADSVPHSTRPPLALWASLALGPGQSSNRDGLRLGVNSGVFGSVGRWTAGVRRGGATGFLEGGGAYDDALLLGIRYPEPNTTLYGVIGPAKIYDESTGVGRFGIGFSAEAGGNLRVVGAGISAYGAWSPGLSYIGIGITLDAGWIR